MTALLRTLFLVAVALTAPAYGQEKPASGTSSSSRNPLAEANARYYRGVKLMLLRSAEKMPAEHYNFRPTEAVRTFGQIIGHAADEQYGFCSLVTGQKRPDLKIEQTRTSKEDLVAALKEALSYCDAAYDRMNDVTAVELITFNGRPTPRLAVLTANNMHSMLHYGNLIVYMRHKNIVPPSSSDIEFRQKRGE
jgi:uncharacterized damage-inducible protein DinB